MRNFNKQAKAFTMLELVFVIVVLGILAALALPRMDRDLRQEAADNILSAIRYTQHLALNDDKTDPFDPDWQKELWQIKFSTTTSTGYLFYVIGSDVDHSGGSTGSLEKIETAIDPSNGKYFYHLNTDPNIKDGESPNLLIGRKYGVYEVVPSGGCSSQQIAFDNIGRPYDGVGTLTNQYESYMKSDCNLTFSFLDGSDDLVISIAKETGYAYIIGQEDS